MGGEAFDHRGDHHVTRPLAISSSVWRCTYAAPGILQSHVLARVVTCRDGGGEVALLARCADNVVSDGNARASLSPIGAKGIGIAIACSTK